MDDTSTPTVGLPSDATADEAARSRCTQIIRSLPIPRPFDELTFLTAVAQQRGKPIELLRTPLDTSGHCGMFASCDAVDYIVHRTDMTALHALHHDMHELGHLLLGHGSPANSTDALHLLLPELSPRLISRILGRGRYNPHEEREADLFASLLMVEARLPTVDMADRSTDLADHLARLCPRHLPVPAGPQWRS